MPVIDEQMMKKQIIMCKRTYILLVYMFSKLVLFQESRLKEFKNSMLPYP